MFGGQPPNGQSGMQQQQQQQFLGAFGSIQPMGNPVNNLFGGSTGVSQVTPAAVAPKQPTMGQLQPTQLAPQPVMQGQAGGTSSYSSFKSIFGGLGTQPVVSAQEEQKADDSAPSAVGADFGSFSEAQVQAVGQQPATSQAITEPTGASKPLDNQFSDFGSFTNPVGQAQAHQPQEQPPQAGAPSFDFGQFGAPGPAGTDGSTGSFGGGQTMETTGGVSSMGDGVATGASQSGGNAASFDFGSFGSPAPVAAMSQPNTAAHTQEAFGSFGSAVGPSAAADSFGSFGAAAMPIAPSADSGISPTPATQADSSPTSNDIGGGGDGAGGNRFDFGSFGAPGQDTPGLAPETALGVSPEGGTMSSEKGPVGGSGGSVLPRSAAGATADGLMPVPMSTPASFGGNGMGVAGGMGGFGGIAPVQRSMDYQFSDLAAVGSGSGLASLSSGKAPTSAADASHEQLKNLFRSLLSAQRFEDAADCRLFSQLRREIAAKRPLWEQAKASQDFVASLELREAVESMEKQMEVLKEKSARWRTAPGPDHTTLADLAKKIQQEAGKQKANEFTAMYSNQFSAALQKGDLPSLIGLLNQAKETANLLKKAEPVIGAAQLKMWACVLQKCVDELKLAVEHLAGIEKELRQGGQAGSDEAAKLLSAPKTVTFVKGLIEMRRIVKRVQLALSYYGPSQKIDVEGMKKLCYEAEGSWVSVTRLLQALNMPQDSSSQEPRADFSKQTFGLGVCAVCMLPGTLQQPSAGSTDVVPTLKWSGSLYHAPCANFYCNLISATPPVRS